MIPVTLAILALGISSVVLDTRGRERDARQVAWAGLLLVALAAVMA